ncbi:precorrin-3B synthase [Pseudomonas baltica]|uniref:precorrin-3B synthase n=1 Tax=Pseudomonas baltica TaxID=2762576 RepID=UPI003908B789
MHAPSPARPLLPAVRPSACPGLLRIVQALDGGICRIKLPGGLLTADQADAVALAARAYAGGVIEATNRANLQIRGIVAEHGAMVEALLAAGLGPRQAAGDDVRNVLLSPAAGLDRQQLLDVRPLAAQLLASLEQEPRLHALSAKFAIQLDGGEALAMLEHHHDVWLSPVMIAGASWMAFGLAGCSGHDPALGAVPAINAHALVLAVLDAFLARATPEQHRLRDLLTGPGATGFVADLSARHPDLGIRTVAFDRAPTTATPIGVHAQRQPGHCLVVAGAALGRLDAEQLRGAADLARRVGDGTLRITPWQGLLLPAIASADAASVQRSLAALGWLVDPAQPLAALIACTGSSGCARGLADTKADAQLLAATLHNPAAVHLSGCARSCAAAHVAPATLLAVGNGYYDLYLRDATRPGFGALQATHITVQEAGALLDARLRSNTHD